jgi:GT2 family glycosyltransferase
MPHNLDIVIVNWNSGALLKECLESLAVARSSELGVGRIVVADNGSTDGSLEEVEHIHPSIQLMRNGRNLGFSVACNQAAVNCNAKYLLFLNPDTRMGPDSLRLPVSFMDDPANETVAICGIRLVDATGRVSRSCCRFPTGRTFFYRATGLDKVLPTVFRGYAMTEWDHARSTTVDHVIGAFFLVRRSVFEALGGFDERYFVYMEDLDFSFRARNAGWRSYYLAEGCTYHAGGAISSQVKAARLFYSLRSRILYALKHFGRASAFSVLVSTILIEPFCRLSRGLLRCSREEIVDTIVGYSMLWKHLPKILT